MQDLTFDAPVIKMAYHPTSVYQNAYGYDTIFTVWRTKNSSEFSPDVFLWESTAPCDTCWHSRPNTMWQRDRNDSQAVPYPSAKMP